MSLGIISKGCNYPNLDHGLHEVKCLDVSKLVIMALLVRYKHMDISPYLYVLAIFSLLNPGICIFPLCILGD